MSRPPGPRDAGVALRQLPLFQDLPQSALDDLARAASRRAYAAGETILVEGELGQAAFFVAAGEARAFRSSRDGREQVLARLGPGQAFNLVPVFQGRGANHATVRALTPVVAYAFAAEDLLRAARAYPELALALLRDFAVRLDRLAELVESLSLRSVRGRLAGFLLRRAEHSAVSRHWTQDDMAAELGTVRDVVGRTLRAFAQEGLVRMDRQRIVLLDREALKLEAES